MLEKAIEPIFPFMDLPLEVRLRIIRDLDTDSVNALGLVNKSFQEIRKYMKEFFIFEKLEDTRDDLPNYLQSIEKNIKDNTQCIEFEILHESNRFLSGPVLLSSVCNAFSSFCDEGLYTEHFFEYEVEKFVTQHLNIIDFLFSKVDYTLSLKLQNQCFNTLLYGFIKFLDRYQKEELFTTGREIMLKILTKLLEKGVDINGHCLFNYTTPLHLVASYYHLDYDFAFARLLMDFGADPFLGGEQNDVFSCVRNQAQKLYEEDLNFLNYKLADAYTVLIKEKVSQRKLAQEVKELKASLSAKPIEPEVNASREGYSNKRKAFDFFHSTKTGSEEEGNTRPTKQRRYSFS